MPGWRCTTTSVGSVLIRRTTVWSTTTTSRSRMVVITAIACSISAFSPAAMCSSTSGECFRARAGVVNKKTEAPLLRFFYLRIRRDSNSRRGSPSHAFEACSLDRSDTYPLCYLKTSNFIILPQLWRLSIRLRDFCDVCDCSACLIRGNTASHCVKTVARTAYASLRYANSASSNAG